MLFLLVALAGEGEALVPAGDFWMGRHRLWFIDEIGWQAEVRMDDRPEHLVYLETFAIDRHEVTNEAYRRFVEETGHRAPFHWRRGQPERARPRLPVYNVSWEDARAYCEWAGTRLPTEAEWEKAARGGLEEAAYPWGDRFEPGKPGKEEDVEEEEGAEEPESIPMAHYGDPNGPTELGSFPANGFGLFDMIGSVWEGVADGYQQHYYSVSPRKEPKGPGAAPYRVIRGGSWADHDERMLAVFYRNFTDPETRASTIGFRCAGVGSSSRW